MVWALAVAGLYVHFKIENADLFRICSILLKIVYQIEHVCPKTFKTIFDLHYWGSTFYVQENRICDWSAA